MGGRTDGQGAGGLRRRMGGGAAMFLGVSILGRISALVAMGALARLLTPEGFGLVAYAAVATGLLTTLVDRHFELSMIRMGEVARARVDTVMTLRVIFAGLLAGALLAGGGALARALGAPELGPMLRALAAVPALSGLFNPRFVLLERDLSFARVAIVEAAAPLASAAVSIALALATGSPWAAVIGMIAASAVRTGASWALAPGGVGLGLADWRDCLRYSAWLIALAALNAVSAQSSRIVAGALLGVVVLGRFRLGAELALSASYFVQRPLLRVAYPGLAAARAEGGDLGRAYLRFQALLVLAFAPVTVAIAVAAPWMVRVVAGEAWPEAVLGLQVIALVGLVNTLASGLNSLILVDGRTWLSFGRQVAVLIVSLPLMWVLGQAHGLPGILVANVMAAVLTVLLTLVIVLRVARLRAGDMWRALHRTGLATLGAGAAGAALAAEAPAADALGLVGALAWGGGIGLGAMALFAAAAAALWILEGRPDGAEAEVADLLRGRLRGRARAG